MYVSEALRPSTHNGRMRAAHNSAWPAVLLEGEEHRDERGAERLARTHSDLPRKLGM